MIGLFIPDPDFYPSRIPNPGVKKAPDPGSDPGYATLVCDRLPSAFLHKRGAHLKRSSEKNRIYVIILCFNSL
jgi:hypothetical protein